MRNIGPEEWAQVRYAYEHTERPVADICAAHRISAGTLRDRRRRGNWRPRRPPVAAWEMTPSPALPPVGGGSAGAVPFAGGSDSGLPFAAGGDAAAAHPPVFAAAQSAGAFPPKERHDAQAAPAALGPSLQSAAARVLPAIEATIARLAAGAHHPREIERASRTLGALTRTLRELNTLLSQPPARNLTADGYDEIPEDLDAFRDRLAHRIRTFVESRMQNGEEMEAADEEATAEET